MNKKRSQETLEIPEAKSMARSILREAQAALIEGKEVDTIIKKAATFVAAEKPEPFDLYDLLYDVSQWENVFQSDEILPFEPPFAWQCKWGEPWPR